MPEAILQWGVNLILTLQQGGYWLAQVLQLFTFLGNLEFFVLALPAIYWCVDAKLGLRVVVVLMLSVAVNYIFKVAFHDPRPYWVEPQVQLWAGAESTFGIPSGHAQNAVVLWGLLAAYANRRWAWIAAASLALLVGFSRIYLGVHFPTDVLTGWILGILLLLAALKFETPVLAWLAGQRAAIRAGVLLAVSLL
ncbi:MAG: phosphatase PAP2 family protein, partial [Chloroflexi bacterium]